MARIIINYPDDVDALIAVQMTEAVISQGRISTGPRGPQFCFATLFHASGVRVICPPKRSDTDTFHIQQGRDGE